MESLPDKKSLTDRHRRYFCASKRNIDRPIIWAAGAYLGFTVLFLPFYDELIVRVTTIEKRCLLIGGLILALLILSNLLRFLFQKHQKVSAVISLVLITFSVSALCNFISLEQKIAKIRPLDGKTVEIYAEVLEWDVTDYGSKYLIVTQKESDIPKEVKARLYSFLEPVADEGDIIHFSVPIQTEIENYDRSRGIFFYAFGGANTIERLEVRETFRNKIIKQADKLYDAPVQGIVEGVLFGEKQNLEEAFRQMMEQAGLVHILAVSGIHISLMAIFCTNLLGHLHLSSRLIKVLVLLPVWGYIALAQFSPSAVRAGIMVSVGVLGWILHREKDSLSALAAAAIAIVLILPFAVYSVSFQLSFVVTLGIIICTKPLTQFLYQTKVLSVLLGRAGKRQEKFLKGICSTISASLAATIFSMPVMLYYFHYTAVWGILASVFALWAVSPLMILAIVSILFGLLSETLGVGIFLLIAKGAAGLAGVFARWILLVSKAVASLPGALFYSHSPQMFWCGMIVIILMILAFFEFRKLSVLQRNRHLKMFAAGAVFCLCSVNLVSMLLIQDKLLIFRTENAMILCRNGQSAVVGDVCSSYEADEIETILRCQGAESLELLLCDSRNTDESAGIDYLLCKFPVKVAAIPLEGAFSAHIEKALGRAPIDPRNLSANLLGGVEMIYTENGVQILAGEKKLLKLKEEYDIIKKDSDFFADVRMGEQEWMLMTPEDSNLGIFYTLEEYPAVQIRMNG